MTNNVSLSKPHSPVLSLQAVTSHSQTRVTWQLGGLTQENEAYLTKHYLSSSWHTTNEISNIRQNATAKIP